MHCSALIVADVGVGVRYWWRSVGGGENDAKRSVRRNNQLLGVGVRLMSGVRWLRVES